MSFSFSRDVRLCSAADFKQVFDKTDIKVACPQLLILAKDNGLEHARLGLVVAKKIFVQPLAVTGPSGISGKPFV